MSFLGAIDIRSADFGVGRSADLVRQFTPVGTTLGSALASDSRQSESGFICEAPTLVTQDAVMGTGCRPRKCFRSRWFHPPRVELQQPEDLLGEAVTKWARPTLCRARRRTAHQHPRCVGWRRPNRQSRCLLVSSRCSPRRTRPLRRLERRNKRIATQLLRVRRVLQPAGLGRRGTGRGWVELLRNPLQSTHVAYAVCITTPAQCPNSRGRASGTRGRGGLAASAPTWSQQSDGQTLKRPRFTRPTGGVRFLPRIKTRVRSSYCRKGRRNHRERDVPSRFLLRQYPHPDQRAGRRPRRRSETSCVFGLKLHLSQVRASTDPGRITPNWTPRAHK